MEESLVCLFNFSEEAIQYAQPGKQFGKKILDSKEDRWMHESHQTKTSEIKKDGSIELMPLSIVVYDLKMLQPDRF